MEAQQDDSGSSDSSLKENAEDQSSSLQDTMRTFSSFTIKQSSTHESLLIPNQSVMSSLDRSAEAKAAQLEFGRKLDAIIDERASTISEMIME